MIRISSWSDIHAGLVFKLKDIPKSGMVTLPLDEESKSFWAIVDGEEEDIYFLFEVDFLSEAKPCLCANYCPFQHIINKYPVCTWFGGCNAKDQTIHWERP